MDKRINIFSLVVYSALCTFPFLFSFQKMAILLFFFAVWYASAISIERKFLNDSFPFVLYLLVFILLDYLAAIMTNRPSEKLLGLNKAPTFTWFILFLFYRDKFDMLKKVIPLLLVSIGIGIIPTIMGNLLYPGASRLLTNNIEYYQEARNFYRSMGIGGYDFVYMLVFLILPVALLIRTKSYRKFPLIALYIAMVICVVLGAFMIGILLSVGFIVLSFVNTSRIRVRSIIIGAVFIFIIINPLLELLSYIGTTYDINALVVHTEEISTGSYVEQEGDYNRFVIYQNALLNWLDHPILGAIEGGTRVNRYSGHSELFGFLEKYGLLAFFYFSFLYKVYKKSKRCLVTTNYKNIFTIIYLAVLLFMIINRFDNFYALGFTFFFFIQVLLMKAERKSLGEI